MVRKKTGKVFALTDFDTDNSFEFDTSIYSDPHVIECIDYITNMTLFNIEFTPDIPESVKTFEQLKPQFSQFLMQYVVEGFAANVDLVTLKNVNIKKRLYYDGWHILYKNPVYTSFTEKETQTVCISTEEFAKDVEYDRFINNSYLTVRKHHIVKKDKLQELVSFKNQVLELLQLATRKTAIPTVMMKVDTIDNNTKEQLLTFLKEYKNASATVLNSEIVDSIEVIDAKPNDKLIFETLSIINSEIASLLGISNAILVSPRSYAYHSTEAVVSIINRNINNLRSIMEGVINEVFEKNSIGVTVALPKLKLDDYDGVYNGSTGNPDTN